MFLVLEHDQYLNTAMEKVFCSYDEAKTYFFSRIGEFLIGNLGTIDFDGVNKTSFNMVAYGGQEVDEFPYCDDSFFNEYGGKITFRAFNEFAVTITTVL